MSEQAELLACGHPVACFGKVNPNDASEAEHCLWCGDIKDMGKLVSNLSETYSHFSGGIVSKPMTPPSVVRKFADDLETNHREFLIKHATEELRAELEAAKAEAAAMTKACRMIHARHCILLDTLRFLRRWQSDQNINPSDECDRLERYINKWNEVLLAALSGTAGREPLDKFRSMEADQEERQMDKSGSDKVMDLDEEARLAMNNLRSDPTSVSDYIMARCVDFSLDSERQKLIAAFLQDRQRVIEAQAERIDRLVKLLGEPITPDGVNIARTLDLASTYWARVSNESWSKLCIARADAIRKELEQGNG